MPKSDGYKNLIPVKKGEKRNPKGKPKGALSYKTLLRHYLESNCVIEGKTKTRLEAIILRQLAIALKGKDDVAIKSIKDILDRHVGKAEENININTDKAEELKKLFNAD